jgi:hypothetical protein
MVWLSVQSTESLSQAGLTIHSSRRRFAVRLNSGVENITANSTFKNDVFVTACTQ